MRYASEGIPPSGMDSAACSQCSVATELSWWAATLVERKRSFSLSRIVIFFWNQTIHYHIYRSKLLVSTISQMNRVHGLMYGFMNINFNIIQPFLIGFWKYSVRVSFSGCIFLPSVLHSSLILYCPAWFNPINSIWGTPRNMQLLSIWFFIIHFFF